MLASSAAEPDTLRPMKTTAASMGASCWLRMIQMSRGTVSSILNSWSCSTSTIARTDPTQNAMRNTVGTARTPMIRDR